MSTALIIGASRGIGREFVRQLLAAGWQVHATARKDADVAALTAAGAHGFKLDVTQPQSLAGLGWQLDGAELDLAVYVAGLYGPQTGASHAPTTEDFDQVMHANVLGAMQAIPLVAPLLEAQGGQFAFLTSAMGSIADVQASTAWLYRASKAALNMVVRSAACEWPKVTMIAVSPGWVQTDMGGPGAPLTVQDSVAGMLRAFSMLPRGDTGCFVDHTGKMLPW